MKTGRTINDLAKEIARQAETKRDFVASTANMRLVNDGDNSRATLTRAAQT